MAIAVEALPAAAEALPAAAAEAGAGAGAEEGGAFRAISAASGQLRRVPGAARTAAGGAGRAYRKLPSSGPSPAVRTITRLLWAVAAGLVVLEIAAQATGQQWSFNLQGFGLQHAPKQPYQPLYAGQPSLVQSAMPGVMGGAAPAGTPGLKLNPGTGGQ